MGWTEDDFHEKLHGSATTVTSLLDQNKENREKHKTKLLSITSLLAVRLTN